MTVRKNHPCGVSDLQALADDHLAGSEREQLVRHLLSCADCRTKYEELKLLAQDVDHQLAGQQSVEIPSLPLKLPVPNEALAISDADVELGWHRLSQRLEAVPSSPLWAKLALQANDKDDASRLEQGALRNDLVGIAYNQTVSAPPTAEDRRQSMPVASTLQTKPFWKKQLTRFAVVAAVLVVGTVVFTTNLGNNALAAMLQTFRVQHLVGVNQDDFSQITQQLQAENGGHVDLKQYGQIDQQGRTIQQMVSLAEASKLMGHPIPSLPGSDPQNDRVSYLSGSDIVFQLHTGPINTLLHRLGGKTEFPATIDGKPFVFHVPPSVNLSQSSKSGLGDANQSTSYNLQIIKAPSLDVPAGVDIEQVRKAMLDLPFVQGNVRNQLLRTEDWKSTLFLPIGSGKAQNITLNGYEAVLNSGPGFAEVMWLQQGYIYTLQSWTNSGESGPSRSVPSLDNLLSMAKEIAG